MRTTKTLDARRHDAHQALEDVAHKVLDTRPDGLEAVGNVLIGAAEVDQRTHQHPDEGDDEQRMGFASMATFRAVCPAVALAAAGHELCHQTPWPD